MTSVARKKVSKMLVQALDEIELRVNNTRPIEVLAENIWCQSGGAYKLDVARWGVEYPVEDLNSGRIFNIHISSFMGLNQASREKQLKLVRLRNSARYFEV